MCVYRGSRASLKLLRRLRLYTDCAMLRSCSSRGLSLLRQMAAWLGWLADLANLTEAMTTATALGMALGKHKKHGLGHGLANGRGHCHELGHGQGHGENHGGGHKIQMHRTVHLYPTCSYMITSAAICRRQASASICWHVLAYPSIR